MNFSIRVKLIGGVLVVFALLITVFAISLNGLNQLDDAVDRIVHEALPEDEEVRDLELQLALQAESYVEYALTLEEEHLHEAREKTDVIIAEVTQLEQQLAREPELLRQLTQFEAEYEQFLQKAEAFAAFSIRPVKSSLGSVDLAASPLRLRKARARSTDEYDGRCIMRTFLAGLSCFTRSYGKSNVLFSPNCSRS